ncbi:Ig-like domain-containing protein [Sandaracinus amylolyticus]|uniref:Ig-like domain-containing protein n=1 Tax=Sandaracinus amylolyticus TaxID=927083 RepID=UPI001F17AB87|nr:Ig-like domain-containing protein [Sandaracinus amylolyticus]UJR83087.1 Hypothetical protein I5071_51530 [Sandaracinus amylolyticus]
MRQRPHERSLSSLLLTACAVALCSACSDTGGPILMIDGGDRQDGGAPQIDGGDRERPRVIATTPERGATGVDVATEIAVTFSEPMHDASSVAIEAEGTPIAIGSETWSDDGTTLTIAPATPLPASSHVRVELDAELADRAGNTLGLPFVIQFTTEDRAAPRVIDSEPGAGATGLSARLDAITITFDEPMNASTGGVRLEGGSGVVGALSWIDGHTVRAPLSGLAYETSYRVVLEGFADVAGNALDASVYLVEGAIPFATGVDRDGPRVTDAVPSEDQVNVSITTSAIVVEFDEAMDTSIGSATLLAGTTPRALAATWSDEGTRASFALAGAALGVDVAHALDLSSMRDASGNALDGATYLGDGHLDFETGADATNPRVLFSDPLEGATGVASSTASLRIVFDQSMDTRVASLAVTRDGGSFDAPASWNAAGTQVQLDVTGQLVSASGFRVDLGALTSARGMLLEPGHYLGDGALDFSTATPTGERCRDELTISEAVARTMAGGYEWLLGADSVSVHDGSNSCATGGVSADAVIRYRKESASGSSGGRYLRVRVVGTASATARIVLDVYRDVCDPVEAARTSARLTCPRDRHEWDTYLDVGAGDYFVWVATDLGTRPFEGAQVIIEEVAATPEGESCAAPFTTSSAVHTTSANGEHVWSVPAGAVGGVDMAIQPGAPGTMVCDVDGRQGPDAVFEIVKTSDDSEITGVVSPIATPSTSIDAIDVQVLDACDPRAPATRSLACFHGLWEGTTTNAPGPRAFDIRGPAGTYYVWVATAYPNIASARPSPAFELRTRELVPGDGESCATAIAIGATGSTTIAPASTASVSTPSCVEPGTNVSWYRFTASENASLVTAGAAGGVATFDRASGRELSCSLDARTRAVAAFVRAGDEVCVAVANGASIGALSIEPVPYTGNMGVPTAIELTPPLDPEGDPITLTLERWVAVTPSSLYLGVTSGMVAFPRSGGGGIHYALPGDQLGTAGIAIGESLFTIDDSTTAGTATRLWRLVGATGAFAPVAWDPGADYPADAFDSLFFDGNDLWIANDGRWLGSTLEIPVTFSRVSATSPATPGPVVTVPAFGDVIGTAIDQTWMYVAARLGIGSTGPVGVYRVERASAGSATPRIERIAELSLLTSVRPLVIDSQVLAQHLYFRDTDGNVRVIAGPGGATPRDLGVLSGFGDTDDFTLARDPASGALFLFDSENAALGRIVRLD